MIPTIRAWVKEQRRMILPENIISISYEYQSIIEQTIYLANDLLPTERDLSEHCFDDIILMQSTGLFDKNGKEIFKGDLVIYDTADDDTIPYEVKFGQYNLSGEFGNKIHLTGFYLQRTFADDYTEIAGLNVTVNWKIIGNIYENPELLEVE